MSSKPDYPHKSYAIFDDKLYISCCGIFCFDLVTNQWSEQPRSLGQAFVSEGKCFYKRVTRLFTPLV
ncbi:hypothetical protein CCACVL1_04366 [Corchorus capsularis]|uniref:Uncharacterized protein n=1 Tax=Corchorus capsularis TaxID=210143 RepID=A0A1R3JT45_COCAP|nr:hypothetical protein CCACVL1_04366 [Corchorus capsularis]